jgi:hypothetical protein
MWITKIKLYNLLITVSSEIIMLCVLAGIFKLVEYLVKYNTGYSYWQVFGVALGYIHLIRIIVYPFRRFDYE